MAAMPIRTERRKLRQVKKGKLLTKVERKAKKKEKKVV